MGHSILLPILYYKILKKKEGEETIVKFAYTHKDEGRRNTIDEKASKG